MLEEKKQFQNSKSSFPIEQLSLIKEQKYYVKS